MTGAAKLTEDLRCPWRHGEHADARGVTLNDPLILDGMDIRGFDLSDASLNGGFSARGTRFRGLAWLRGTRVRGACDLSGASFRTDFRADGLVAQEVVLDGCGLWGVMSLTGSRLASLSLRRALVLANLALEGAEIDGVVDCSGAEIMGGIWSVGARFGSFRDGGAEISGRVRMPD